MVALFHMLLLTELLFIAKFQLPENTHLIKKQNKKKPPPPQTWL